MRIINTSVIKNVFLRATNVIPSSKIDKISKIIPKNASLVQNRVPHQHEKIRESSEHRRFHPAFRRTQLFTEARHREDKARHSVGQKPDGKNHAERYGMLIMQGFRVVPRRVPAYPEKHSPDAADERAKSQHRYILADKAQLSFKSSKQKITPRKYMR